MKCDHDLNKVTDSRKKEYGTFRRRECIKCGKRWTTIEIKVGDVRQGESSYTAVKRYLLSEVLIKMGKDMKK